MKAIVAACVFAFGPVAVWAGDPCPIRVNIVDIGAPEWLDRDELLSQLDARQPWIGIDYRDTPQGIVLSRVDSQSPAATAGLAENDLVTAINGVATIDIAARETLLDTIVVGDTLTFARLGKTPVTFTIGRTDPVALGLSHALSEQECRVSNFRVAEPQERVILLPLMFNPNRSFRCDDAHLALRALGERSEIDEVYVVRGSRRLLLSMPYWGSTCVIGARLDGDGLTDEALIDAVRPVIDGFVQDRHNNP